MLNYQAVYRLETGTFFVVVQDFPDAVAFASTLSEARARLLATLRFAAERALRAGEMLPLPSRDVPVADAYLVESIRVLPRGDNQVSVEVR
jgi:predicted RNase H-like HicB family nuclease